MTSPLRVFFTILMLFAPAIGHTQNSCEQLFRYEQTFTADELLDRPDSPLIRDAQRLKEIKDMSAAEKRDAYFAYARPSKKSWRSKSMVIANWAMATYMTVQIALGFHADPSTIVPAVLAIPPTLFAADVVGQTFHKWLDSYASEESLFWGKAAREFRKHHEVPSNLNEVDYLSHVSSFGVLLAPAFVAASASHMPPAEATASLFFMMSLMNATEIHRQAHRVNPSKFFAGLQKLRLVINKDDHASHHRAPFDEDYAVINGWSQILTKRTRLWERLDMIWWKTFNKLPKNWIQDPRSIPPSVLVELQSDISKIPDDLWAYAEVYPKRLPPELKELREK